MRILMMCCASLFFLAVQPAGAHERPDIKEVIKVTMAPDACGVSDAVMTYRDSTGATHTYTYQTWSYDCETYQ